MLLIPTMQRNSQKSMITSLTGKGVMNVWWIGILIGVGFGLLIWFLIWYYKKHPEAKTEQWLSVANGISDIVGMVLKAIDKDPKTENVTERIYRYASLAVANVEQSFQEDKSRTNRRVEISQSSIRQ